MNVTVFPIIVLRSFQFESILHVGLHCIGTITVDVAIDSKNFESRRELGYL